MNQSSLFEPDSIFLLGPPIHLIIMAVIVTSSGSASLSGYNSILASMLCWNWLKNSTARNIKRLNHILTQHAPWGGTKDSPTRKQNQSLAKITNITVWLADSSPTHAHQHHPRWLSCKLSRSNKTVGYESDWWLTLQRGRWQGNTRRALRRWGESKGEQMGTQCTVNEHPWCIYGHLRCQSGWQSPSTQCNPTHY